MHPLPLLLLSLIMHSSSSCHLIIMHLFPPRPSGPCSGPLKALAQELHMTYCSMPGYNHDQGISSDQSGRIIASSVCCILLMRKFCDNPRQMLRLSVKSMDASFAGSRAPRLHGEVPHLCCSSRAQHQFPEGTAFEAVLAGEGHGGSATQEAVPSFCMVSADSRILCRGMD